MVEVFRRCVIVVVVLLGILVPHSQGRRVREPTEFHPTLLSALNAIESRYKVRIGLEYAYAPQDADTTAVRLDLSGNEVAPVLNSLIAQRTDYTWSLENGV